MVIEFYDYDDETDVEVAQDTMTKSTTHIAIENSNDLIKLYMSDDEVQEFINKLQKSLDRRREKK